MHRLSTPPAIAALTLFTENQIAFYALTGPDEFGVYMATIPEPGTGALAMGGLALLLLRRRR